MAFPETSRRPAVRDAGAEAATMVPVRHAASLIAIRMARSGRAEVLLGKRRATQTFVPHQYVFPGGRLEDADVEMAGLMPAEHRFDAPTRNALAHDVDDVALSANVHALGLTALRETFEETGLLFGRPERRWQPKRAPGSPGWQHVLAHGALPGLSGLIYLGRAITPPGRPRRYDTRFFVCQGDAPIATADATDGEFEALVWADATCGAGLDLHVMTRQIFNDVMATAAVYGDAMAGGANPPCPVFYNHVPGGFAREPIPQSGA